MNDAERYLNVVDVEATCWAGEPPAGMASETPLEGRHHRGGDDAWNIAALVLDLAVRGRWPA